MIALQHCYGGQWPYDGAIYSFAPSTSERERALRSGSAMPFNPRWQPPMLVWLASATVEGYARRLLAALSTLPNPQRNPTVAVSRMCSLTVECVLLLLAAQAPCILL